jgi:hypothetical protein
MYNTEMLNALEKSDIPTAIYYIEEITKMLLEMGEYDLYTEYM